MDKNTRRLSKKDIINRAYREITARGIFDEKEGNKPIKVVDHLDEITEKMYEHILENNFKVRIAHRDISKDRYPAPKN